MNVFRRILVGEGSAFVDKNDARHIGVLVVDQFHKTETDGDQTLRDTLTNRSVIGRAEYGNNSQI